MGATAKAVKVGEKNYEVLSEIAVKYGGTLKENLDKALDIYLGYVNNTLAVRRPFGGRIELVNIEDLLESDDVSGSYTPVFGEFSPEAIEIFLKIAEKHVDRNEPVLVTTIPAPEVPKYSPRYLREHFKEWEEEFDTERCFEYVMKGYSVNVGLKTIGRNMELALKYANIFPENL